MKVWLLILHDPYPGLQHTRKFSLIMPDGSTIQGQFNRILLETRQMCRLIIAGHCCKEADISETIQIYAPQQARDIEVKGLYTGYYLSSGIQMGQDH
jgi:hypothetical protein